MFLLFSGRSIVFVLTAALGITVAWLVWPHVGGAEQLMNGPYDLKARHAAGLWANQPDSALPALAAAIATALVSLPYAGLHLWHSLFGAPRSA